MKKYYPAIITLGILFFISLIFYFAIPKNQEINPPIQNTEPLRANIILSDITIDEDELFQKQLAQNSNE